MKNGTFGKLSGFDELENTAGGLASLDITKTAPEPKPIKYRSTSTKLTEESWKALKVMSASEERHMHDLFQEAVDLLLAKHRVGG